MSLKGYQTGYTSQEEQLNTSETEPWSANATMEMTGGFRNSMRIPVKKSMALRKSNARTRSVNMHNRYANDSKIKLDHTSFI
jgi:hypothetical protein